VRRGGGGLEFVVLQRWGGMPIISKGREGEEKVMGEELLSGKGQPRLIKRRNLARNQPSPRRKTERRKKEGLKKCLWDKH